MLAGMSSAYEQVADRLRQFLMSHTGEVREISGKQFLPVSIVAGGLGGGEDTSADVEKPQAKGIGGGGVAVPLGVYRVDEDGDLEFQANPITFMAVAIPFVAVLGCTIRRILKVAKKKS